MHVSLAAANHRGGALEHDSREINKIYFNANVGNECLNQTLPLA